MVLHSGSRNIVHRHEPPVTSKPVKILHRDQEREFIVIDKPGSIVRSSYPFQPLTEINQVSLAGTRRWTVPQKQSHWSTKKWIRISKGLLWVFVTSNWVIITNLETVVNRLDRLTSGLMIVPLSSASANKLAVEFASGEVKKEYIARVLGEFPEWVSCTTTVYLRVLIEFEERTSLVRNPFWQLTVNKDWT